MHIVRHIVQSNRPARLPSTRGHDSANMDKSISQKAYLCQVLKNDQIYGVQAISLATTLPGRSVDYP